MSSTIVGTPPTQREARPSIRRLRRGQIMGGVLLLALLIVVILATFGAPLWRILGAGILLLTVAVVVLLVNWVRLRPILRDHVRNRRET